MSMRNHYFDNLKFILIFLVVLGHYLGRYRAESSTITGVYLFLYLFHMPVFAFISGYFSKTFEPRVKDVAFLLIPYVFFQIAYISYYSVLGLQDGEWGEGMSLTLPFMHNWYLLSLVGWRLMSLYARQWRYAVPFSFVLALLAGFEPSIEWHYSASRTICFFPFFLLGIKAEACVLDKLVHFRGLAWLLLLSAFVFSMAISYIGPATASLIAWTSFYATGYDLPSQIVTGPAYRLGLYSAAVVLGLSFLAIVPRKKTWFTHLGMRTMTVYLLHNFFVFGLKKIYPHYQPWITEGILLVSAIGTTFLLSTAFVHQGLQYPFVMINRLLKKKPGGDVGLI